MQPVGLDGLAQFLGPGTGGLWMGEQQRNAMQESELGQQRTIADIARMKQEQEFNQQMNPLKIEQQQNINKRAPVELEGLELGNQEKKDKLKKSQYADFLTALSTEMDPSIVGMADRAAILNDIAKRTGVEPGHPMYEVALKAHAAGPEAFKRLQEAIGVSPETRYREAQANARTDRSNDRMERNTQLIQETQERIRREDREAKLKIAEMRVQEGKKAEQLKNYEMAAIHFRGAAIAAQDAGDVEKARFYFAESARNEQLHQLAKAAGANAPGRQPMEIPGMPPRAAPPSLPPPGPALPNTQAFTPATTGPSSIPPMPPGAVRPRQ